MRYTDGELIKVGDVFTDGAEGREDVRLKNRAKVLYVDKFQLVWFPLNEFTYHNHYIQSQTYGLSRDPKKVELSELTEEELENYNLSDKALQDER